MKKKVIAFLLSVVLASGSIVPALAVETASETTAEEAVIEEETAEETTEESEEITEETADAETEEVAEGASEEESAEEIEEGPAQELTEEAEDGETETIEEAEIAEDPEEADSADTADTSAEMVEVEETEAEGKEAALAEGDIVDSGTCGDNLNWKITGEGNDLTLTIYGIGDMYDYAVVASDGYVISGGTHSPWMDDSVTRGKINHIVVSEGVTGIGRGAFGLIGASEWGQWARIADITLPSTLTRIGYAAFCHTGCDQIFVGGNVQIDNSSNGGGFYFSNFRQVNIASKNIGGFGESRVEKIVVQDGAETILGDAFRSCKYLKSVEISSSVTSIESGAFDGCTILETVTIPVDSELETIGHTAFYNCTKLTNIYLPEKLTSIDYEAFWCCSSLVSIDIPDSVISMGWSVFNGCTSLKNIKLSEKIDKIKSGTFSRCSSLESITIPDSVTQIGSSAFANCDKLSSILIPANVDDIAVEFVFKTGENPAFAGSEGLAEIKVDPNNSTYKSYDGCLYNSDYTTLLYCPEGKDRIILSPSITEITRSALLCGGTGEDTSKITEIYFGISSPEIAENAFSAINGTAYYNNFLNNWSSENLQSYGGSITWNEKALDLHDCSMTISPTSYMYDGTAKKPNVTISYSGYDLTDNENYTLSYTNNINAGTGTVTATGKGFFTGTISKEFTITQTYIVKYDANGGTGTPSSQTKKQNIDLTLSSIKPTKRFVLRYNSNGGTVTPSSKNLDCTFKNWNTEKRGVGTTYASGSRYSNNADVTLYAQWTNPIAGELATPTRNGYAFMGWYTSATGGTQITNSSTITENTTVYAHWADPYNIGDDTYSFSNYPDFHSSGHCFGMSITSAGYYNNLLNKQRIGGNASTSLYSFNLTPIVKEPICFYQMRQGSYSRRAIVAGGSSYIAGSANISSDWQEVISFVKGHKYDNTGIIQIGFRQGIYGHAINFLRYENVNGQDRIYAYDNNFPNQETYFFQDSYGRVFQTPVQTFSGAIDCIALRDCRTYFSIVDDFDSTHVIYMPKDAATVQGYNYTYMDSVPSDEVYVMYEIPDNQNSVTIIPNKDYADFIYMDTEFSFGEITEDTRGELRFSSMDENSGGMDASFVIYENSPVNPTVTLSKKSFTYNGQEQKPSVAVKVGSTILREGQDYSVEYPSDMVNVGVYKIKVTLNGAYSGVIYESFEITASPTLPTVKLSSSSFVYNGKEQKPTVVVKDGDTTLEANKDYTVSYANNKNAGTAKVTIKCIGDYTGTVTKTFKITQAANKITGSNYTRSYSTKAQTLTLNAKATGGKLTYKSNKSAVKVTSKGKVTIAAKFSGTATITVTAGNTNYKTATKKIYVVVPTKTALSSVKSPAAGKMKITWKKNTAVTGYQIQYSLKSSFASPKTKTISKNSQIATTISSLTKGKKYYLRIRSFKTVSGKKYYSAWSAAKTVTIKK